MNCPVCKKKIPLLSKVFTLGNYPKYDTRKETLSYIGLANLVLILAVFTVYVS